MWSTFNHILNIVFDGWLSPFSGLTPVWQILALALPATIFSLLVFRYSSNQDAIRREKDKIKAYLLEMRLFKDDLGVTLRAEKKIFRHTASYMGHALMPMFVMIVPFILILVQVESRFAFKSLELGQQAILSVTVDEARSVKTLNPTLELPGGLVKTTPAMRIDATKEILWRIQAKKPGKYRATVKIEDQIVEKLVLVNQGAVALSPILYRADDIRTIGYPAEPAFDVGLPVTEIELTYTRARDEFGGLSSASWLLMLFTLILGFAMRGLFGVTF